MLGSSPRRMSSRREGYLSKANQLISQLRLHSNPILAALTQNIPEVWSLMAMSENKMKQD